LPASAEASPPAAASDATSGTATLLAAQRRDRKAVVLDLDDAPEFNRRVYALARAVPPGETSTYGDIARRLGEPGAAREVGRALGENPFPIVVPCHRVLGAGGKVGGFSARGGVATKARLLSIEGARTDPDPLLFESLPIPVKPGRRS
ncbi:MAG: methylated-DNA--[protein]-cysteine S-methyltransferase, partial [Caulobacteraceae bacterium]